MSRTFFSMCLALSLLACGGDFVVVEADDHLEDLVGVLAQERRTVDFGRGIRELDRISDSQVRTALRMVNLDNRACRA